ncbi:MAG: hypothetical protein CR972_00095 [Candidatus Moraniibacteriota bacterium]|nr:MAG: hypothetical protein CR972_00095 [Candidatus Moranbacteria bacterium]
MQKILCFTALFASLVLTFLNTQSEAAIGANEIIRFSWRANTEPVTGYKLYYAEGAVTGPPFNGKNALQGNSPINVGNVTQTSLSGLDVHQNYSFALTAFNECSESAFTDVIIVYSVTISIHGNGTVGTYTSFWTENHGNETIHFFPSDGHFVSNVVVNGTSFGSTESITLNDVTEKKVIDVYFSPEKTVERDTSFPLWSGSFNENADVQGSIFIASDGVYVSQTTDTYTTNISKVSDGFCPKSGWNANYHLIQFIDVDNDGWLDIAGFGYNGLVVAYGIDGTNYHTAVNVISGNFGYNNGWRIDHHIREISDIDGDGVNDVWGFGYNGLVVAYGIDGTNYHKPKLALNSFGYNDGWEITDYRRFLDVDNDGYLDISGWKDGVNYVSLFNSANETYDNIVEWW